MSSSLKSAMKLSGAVAIAVVDQESGMCLGQAGSSNRLELAAAGNSEVIRAKMRVMRDLALKDEIEDILITLGKQYHMIRLIKTRKATGLFLYCVLDREKANLSMARLQLAEIGKTFKLS